MSLILLGDCNTERLDDRKAMCFTLMDFDDMGEITVDELVTSRGGIFILISPFNAFIT